METNKKNETKEWKKSAKSGLDGYVKYSNIAFQMIAIILLGLFGGIKLDDYLELAFPVFTLFFTLISFALAIYNLIRQILK